MKNRIADVRAHLRDNTGDENITKMIWIVIVFVVGALLLGAVTGAFEDIVQPWLTNIFNDWFVDNNGGFPE